MKFCFNSSSIVDFKVKVKVSVVLSDRGILYFKVIWIDEMQIITESRISQLQSIIFIAEIGLKVWANFASLFLVNP